MLTSRGWWFLVAVLGLVAAGLASGTTALSLAALSLLIWFSAQWLWFGVRVRWSQGRWVVRRRLGDERTTLKALWARQHAAVQVALTCEAPWTHPYVLAVDRLPPLAELKDGTFHAAGELRRGQALEFSYRIVCPAPGLLLFWGLKIHLADLHGFFTATLFVRAPQRYRVLPPLADARGRLQSAKRHNLLPLMGTHPHRRPGAGSELLDLRDYLPGDPPKMIAWKASARRDRLMTKVYESEVPVRCTLFVDVAGSVRLGPVGRTPLARLVEIAAIVTQANAAARDLTGLCLFDDDRLHAWMRPKRGARQVTTIMDRLAEAAALAPEASLGPLDRYLPLAYGLAQDVYPDLLDEEVNAFPWWLPFWSPRPAFTMPRPAERPRTVAGKLWHGLKGLMRDSPLALAPKGTGRWSPRAHRLYRWRKKVAALLSVRYGLAPGGLGRLLEDDWDCFHYVQRFLAEHQVGCPTPLYDEQGRYIFASEKKWERLARALIAAVVRAQDNELLVLLADFLEAGPGLEKVQQAVRLALARHHRVLIVCPWPASVRPPRRPGASGLLEPITADSSAAPARTLQDFLWQASTARLHQAFEEVRRTFAPMGVQVICARQDDVPALILHRMRLLRTLERGVR